MFGMPVRVTTSDKTRLSTQRRSEGDGMENVRFVEESSANKLLSEAYESSNYYKPLTKSPIKPKFVPYEPYKVAPAVLPNANENESCRPSVTNVHERVHSVAVEEIVNKSFIEKYVAPKTEIGGVVSCNCAEKTLQLEEKICRLELEKKELEVQFDVQTQVNADLKKMLVASLGEDLQEKLQYMTEDKARLGKNVLLCSDLMRQKDEEIEKLSVESDVWKSKFEASSVMVDELARFKSTLTQKLNESLRATESLLRENEQIYRQQYISHSVLEHIQGAFNPSVKNPPNSRSWNLLEISKEIFYLSNGIQSRLLGTSTLNPKAVPDKQRQLTTAENSALEVLSSLDGLPNLIKLKAALYRKPGTTACQVLSHTCSEDPTINCCRHCSGEILQV